MFSKVMVNLFTSEKVCEIPAGWFKPAETTVEKVLSYNRVAIAATVVAGAIGYGAYALRRRPLQILADPLCVAPEGLVPGNNLMEGQKLPKCQVTIGQMREGKLWLVGGAVRMKSYLVSAAHNFSIGAENYVIGVNGFKHKLDPEDEFSVAADVAAYELSEEIWSRLGAAVHKLGPLASEAQSTAAIISSCDNRGSVAQVRIRSGTIGRVAYYGSTEPGFSGAPYMSGPIILGVHTHGGAVAGGYEALYIWTLIKIIRNLKEESSEFLLQNLKGKDYAVERHADYVIIREPSGHYAYTDEQMFSRLEAIKTSTQEVDDWIGGKNTINWADMVETEELEEELARRRSKRSAESKTPQKDPPYVPEGLGVSQQHVVQQPMGQQPLVKQPMVQQPTVLAAMQSGESQGLSMKLKKKKKSAAQSQAFVHAVGSPVYAPINQQVPTHRYEPHWNQQPPMHNYQYQQSPPHLSGMYQQTPVRQPNFTPSGYNPGGRF